MKKYLVHAYALVRVRSNPIKAESQQDAIKKFPETDMHKLLDCEFGETGKFHHMASAEELHHYLVDEVGDEGYENSEYYDQNRDPMITNLPNSPITYWSHDLMVNFCKEYLKTSGQEAHLLDEADQSLKDAVKAFAERNMKK